MNAKQLKDSILQYAMQGKLVENIEDIKFKEVWNKKILSNKKRKPILDDEIPFDIPSNWVWARVGDLGVVKTGNTPSTTNIEYYNEKYIPFIKPGDFIEGALNYDNEYLSEKGAEKARLIAPDSILMVCIGGSRGKCAYNVKEVACNQQINTLTVDSDLINIQYIFNIMQSQYFQNLMIEKATGTATPIINKSNWSNFIVPIAPLKEQIEIVEKINELFLSIQKYERLYRYVEDLKDSFPRDLEKSILQYAMQGKLIEQDSNDEPAQQLIEKIQVEKGRLIKEKVIKKEKPLSPITEDEIPFEIPNNWRWVRLGEIIHATNAGKSPRCVEKSAEANEWGVIKTTAIQKNEFLQNQNKVLSKDFEIKSEYVIHEGDVLITRAGPKNRVGISCCVDKITNNVILSDKTIRINISTQLLYNKYIMYALNSDAIRPLLEAKMTGMASSQVNISQNNLKSVIIPLPPLNEQKRIVQEIEKIMVVKDKLIKL